MLHEFTAFGHVLDWATLVLAAALLLLALFWVVDKLLDFLWPAPQAPHPPTPVPPPAERRRLSAVVELSTFGRGPGERRPMSGTTRAHEAGASASTPESDPRRI